MRVRPAPTVPSGDALNALAQPALASVLDHLPFGLTIISRDGRIKHLNRAFRLAFGLTECQVGPGDSLATLLRMAAVHGALGPIGGTEEEDIARRLASLADEAPPDERRVLADGRIFDVVRRRTDEGDLVSAHVDVTESARTEAALERQHRHLRTIINNISDGLALIDADGKLIAFNRRWLELYKLDPAAVWVGIDFVEVCGLLGDLATLSPARRGQEAARRAAFALDPQQTSTVRHLFTGETYALSKALTPDGATVMTVRDITDTLRQQRVLDEERQREREASEHQSRFLTRMSHEMRTPMNGVLGIAALLD
ncbi:MAG: PAS-domain containing protein, partial [Pseudomonadota bacterium]